MIPRRHSFWSLGETREGGLPLNPCHRPLLAATVPSAPPQRTTRGLVSRPLSPFEALTGVRFWDHDPLPELDEALPLPGWE